MNNKVVNKQIPLETIVKVANHLEDYKENYDRKFELEQNKNKNIPYGEKQWEYENGNTTINYTIEFKNGKNIFVDPEDPTRLSEEAYYFIGGLLAHSKEMALITNPIVNSYKRLVPGYEAPTELTWTKNNQNSLVRIPGSRGMETRIELRSPDAAANPYLVFAVCLAAGLDGINKKIYPTKSSSRELSETDQKTMKIENLPGNLNEAIDYFEQSDWIKEVLGTEFCKEYAAAKKKEWLRYTREISAWEIEEYLYRI